MYAPPPKLLFVGFPFENMAEFPSFSEKFKLENNNNRSSLLELYRIPFSKLALKEVSNL